MTPCEAAMEVADSMLEYRRARTNRERQDEVWQQMLNQLDVYVAAKRAAAVLRLEGMEQS